ncbi:hypothetical protein CSKR_108370 [Clonorchis sinensis]|uniref:Uncharacterized protein n=1 Tax=Clonorchis sinensis TaxID=79923 RepID=A0A3R7EXV0_CLOSI|nr:hypothetical protein CSKR_108370 [Clonorchis sinensis]
MRRQLGRDGIFSREVRDARRLGYCKGDDSDSQSLFFSKARAHGLGNLAVSQPSRFLRVAWQLGTERVLQLNDDHGNTGFSEQVAVTVLTPSLEDPDAVKIPAEQPGMMSKKLPHPSTRWMVGAVVRQRSIRAEHDVMLPMICLGNLAVSQPSRFLRVAWQLGTERVLQLNDDHGNTGFSEQVAVTVLTPSLEDPDAVKIPAEQPGNRAKTSLFDWTLVDSRPCGVHPATSVRESRGSGADRIMFIVSAYTPNDRSSESAKHSCYDDMVSDNMNAQSWIGHETHGQRISPALDVCDRRLFLCTNHFQNSGNHLTMWYPPTDQPRIQLDPIAVNQGWRGAITVGRSFWATSMDSNHALVPCCFSGPPKTCMPTLAVAKLVDREIKRNYQNRLVERRLVRCRSLGTDIQGATQCWNLCLRYNPANLIQTLNL